MTNLTCTDPRPVRLHLDPNFRPCEPQEEDELYPNGIFEFNITRLLAHIGAAARFQPELVELRDIPHTGSGSPRSEAAILAADLTRPVILAEIAPHRYNLIDGHHRVAKARRQGVLSIPAFRVRCPEHVAFLTSTRAYEAYVKYWNSKVDETSADRAFARRPRGDAASRSLGSSRKRIVRPDRSAD